jgi:uncharacterized protein (TIGR02284 family)
MKNYNEAIEALNSLIVINNDRIEGYQTAEKETEELDLKSMFSQFIKTSQKCNHELTNEVNQMGGTIATGTTTSGKFFRVWMDVQAALSGKDRKLILDSCEFGEENASNTYIEVVENKSLNLSEEQLLMINAQLSLLRNDHNHVKGLRDAIKD